MWLGGGCLVVWRGAKRQAVGLLWHGAGPSGGAAAAGRCVACRYAVGGAGSCVRWLQATESRRDMRVHVAT